jgi:hypothetical protein
MPMNDHGTETPRSGVAAIGVGAFAVARCAAGPLLVAVVSSAALGIVLGVGAGVAALVALAAATRRRRRPAVYPGRKGERA